MPALDAFPIPTPPAAGRDFIHYPFYADRNQLVSVDLDARANVMLLDNDNFDKYVHGREFKYYGGHFNDSPAQIRVPVTGHWNLVIDLGGYPGTVTTKVNIK